MTSPRGNHHHHHHHHHHDMIMIMINPCGGHKLSLVGARIIRSTYLLSPLPPTYPTTTANNNNNQTPMATHTNNNNLISAMCADLQILPPDPTHTTPYPFQTLTYTLLHLIAERLSPPPRHPRSRTILWGGGGEKLSGQIHPSDP